MTLKRKNQSKINYQTLDFSAASLEFVSAQELLDIMKNRSHELETIDFTRPSIGGAGFGKFRVKWKTPHYQMVS